jgi:preprotein translocase subunit SecF
LKEIVTISKKLKSEEDSKEEHYEHKVSPKGSKSLQEEGMDNIWGTCILIVFCRVRVLWT